MEFEACSAENRAVSSACTSQRSVLGRIVDLQRYPIDDLSTTKALQLIEKCQADFRTIGSVTLPGFIREDVIKKMAQEVEDLPAYNRLEVVPTYGTAIGHESESMRISYPPEHPVNRKWAQDLHAVAADSIPIKSLIRQVYDSPEVAAFLAKVLNIDHLYQFADEFQCINIMYMYDGGSRAWHYDGSDFVITLMLQPSDEGGEFEFAPFIRGPLEEGTIHDERYEQVQQVLSGKFPTRVSRAAAGTLNLFSGRRSLHRVRSVYGPNKRMIAVLSYDTKEGMRGLPAKNVALYGDRVRAIYTQRGIDC